MQGKERGILWTLWRHISLQRTPYIPPVITCDLEILTVTKNLENKLESCQQGTERDIFGIT